MLLAVQSMSRAMNVIQLRTKVVQALSLFEARERIADTTFLPSDDGRSDCWPDWHRDFPAPAELAAREVNTPRQVLLEAGLVLAVPLLLACLVTWLIPG